jgi:AcrR family transcriptional regulator
MARSGSSDKSVVSETGKAALQRDRIRRAAVRLFNRFGYEATSIKDLARVLKMVPANIYNYYPSKEDILFDVMEFQLSALLKREQQIMDTVDSPSERIRSLTYDLIERDLRDPLDAFVGRNGLQGLTRNRKKVISQKMGAIRAIWVRTITEGVELNEFHSSEPKLDALTLLTLCSSIATWFSPTGEYKAEQVASRTADLIIKALSTP